MSSLTLHLAPLSSSTRFESSVGRPGPSLVGSGHGACPQREGHTTARNPPAVLRSASGRHHGRLAGAEREDSSRPRALRCCWLPRRWPVRHGGAVTLPSHRRWYDAALAPQLGPVRQGGPRFPEISRKEQSAHPAPSRSIPPTDNEVAISSPETTYPFTAPSSSRQCRRQSLSSKSPLGGPQSVWAVPAGRSRVFTPLRRYNLPLCEAPLLALAFQIDPSSPLRCQSTSCQLCWTIPPEIDHIQGPHS
jgi:hypothetical protein